MRAVSFRKKFKPEQREMPVDKINHKPTLPATVRQVQINLNFKSEGKRKSSKAVVFKYMDHALVIKTA